MSLLPMALFSYSITVPGKDKILSYETLAKFRSVELSAERDGFASNADKLGSKALSDLLEKGLTPDAQVKIEEDYNKFFNMLIGLTQLDTRCSYSPCQTVEDLIAGFSAIEAEAELVQIRLKLRAATVIGSQQERFQVADGFVQPM